MAEYRALTRRLMTDDLSRVEELADRIIRRLPVAREASRAATVRSFERFLRARQIGLRYSQEWAGLGNAGKRVLLHLLSVLERRSELHYRLLSQVTETAKQIENAFDEDAVFRHGPQDPPPITREEEEVIEKNLAYLTDGKYASSPASKMVLDALSRGNRLIIYATKRSFFDVFFRCFDRRYQRRVELWAEHILELERCSGITDVVVPFSARGGPSPQEEEEVLWLSSQYREKLVRFINLFRWSHAVPQGFDEFSEEFARETGHGGQGPIFGSFAVDLVRCLMSVSVRASAQSALERLSFHFPICGPLHDEESSVEPGSLGLLPILERKILPDTDRRAVVMTDQELGLKLCPRTRAGRAQGSSIYERLKAKRNRCEPEYVKVYSEVADDDWADQTGVRKLLVLAVQGLERRGRETGFTLGVRLTEEAPFAFEGVQHRSILNTFIESVDGVVIFRVFVDDDEDDDDDDDNEHTHPIGPGLWGERETRGTCAR